MTELPQPTEPLPNNKEANLGDEFGDSFISFDTFGPSTEGNTLDTQPPPEIGDEFGNSLITIATINENAPEQHTFAAKPVQNTESLVSETTAATTGENIALSDISSANPAEGEFGNSLITIATINETTTEQDSSAAEAVISKASLIPEPEQPIATPAISPPKKMKNFRDIDLSGIKETAQAVIAALSGDTSKITKIKQFIKDKRLELSAGLNQLVEQFSNGMGDTLSATWHEMSEQAYQAMLGCCPPEMHGAITNMFAGVSTPTAATAGGYGGGGGFDLFQPQGISSGSKEHKHKHCKCSKDKRQVVKTKNRVKYCKCGGAIH